MHYDDEPPPNYHEPFSPIRELYVTLVALESGLPGGHPVRLALFEHHDRNEQVIETLQEIQRLGFEERASDSVAERSICDAAARVAGILIEHWDPANVGPGLRSLSGAEPDPEYATAREVARELGIGLRRAQQLLSTHPDSVPGRGRERKMPWAKVRELHDRPSWGWPKGKARGEAGE